MTVAPFAMGTGAEFKIKITPKAGEAGLIGGFFIGMARLLTNIFTNTGNAPLIITNVLSTCGCTVPTKPDEPIMPGKTGKITVKYNMAPGPIRKTITVESNAVNYEGGRVALKIKGEVISN